MDNFKDIKLKIDSGEFTVVQRPSRKSGVYNVFYGIKDNNGEFLKHAVQCTRCKNVYTANQKTTSNLVRHHCYKKYKASQEQEQMSVKQQPSEELKNNCMELVVQWIVGNCRPCNIVNDEGLHKLVEFFVDTGHAYGHNVDIKTLIPHSPMVTRVISNLYNDQHGTLKEELHSIKDTGFSITCDLWTDNFTQTSYIGAIGHYMKAGSIVYKVLGMREVSMEPNTAGSNIRYKIDNILREFDCELNHMVTLVIDTESSKIQEAFRHHRNIICINHLLNNVLEQAVSDTPKVQSIATNCSKLVDYFKKTGVNSELNDMLASYIPTRWNTIYHILQAVKQNLNIINQILTEKNMVSRLANLNLPDINDILEVLRPFEEALKLLQGENYPTLHHVYPQIRKLKTITNKQQPNDSEMIKQFKEQLLHHLESVIDRNINDVHKIALFLFPPANKLLNFTDNEKRHILEKCNEMLQAYEKFRTNSSNMTMSMEFVVTDADTDAFSDFVQSSVTPAFEDEISSEVFRYERQSVLYYKQFDPLEWWETHRREYPLLYRLACFVLSTPASCAVTERIFSKAPNLLSDSFLERNPIGVNRIMFLHSNLDLNVTRNQDFGVDSKSHDSESDSESLNCSTPTPTLIKKCSSPIPD